ncbi:MAG: tetratricopeptide repeat protein [Planctomycetaceae bacterium]|nr:tetratricopeptide repeat protein [Planctomycetaceae bacterium]
MSSVILPGASVWTACSRVLRLAAFLSLSLLLGASGCAQSQNSSGVSLFQAGNYPAAMAKFQQALATDPQNADSYYNLAATHHRLGKMQNNKAELDQAENLYHQCLDRDPNHADCYRGLAVLLVEENRSGDAFKLLEGWSTRNPALSEPKIQLARLYEEFSDKTAAKEQLVEALGTDPYNARALAALGRLHETSGNPSQALAVYERSLWHNSAQPDVAARVATLRGALGTVPAPPPGSGTQVVGLDGPLVR